MPSNDKERYIYVVLKKILELNPNGATISMIKKATGFNHTTIWHHLDKMTTTREAYALDYGNATIYFANGKMVHHLKNVDISLHDKQYSFILVENNFGKYIYLQEKKENRLGVTEICGGLLLPYSLLDEFISSLRTVKAELAKDVNDNDDSKN